jgi:hypothetical protein
MAVTEPRVSMPVRTPERASRIGREAGLRLVYRGVGNTCCPGCWPLLIARWGLRVARCRLEEGRCPVCGSEPLWLPACRRATPPIPALLPALPAWLEPPPRSA